MKKKDSGNNSSSVLSDVRRRAEERIKNRKGVTSHTRQKEDIERLVHELEVHQVELEIQNEELRNTLAELEESRKRYVELYDFAPVGYLKLNNKGIIAEANLAGSGLLGVSRGDLIGSPFARYIIPDYQDIFYLHVKEVLRSKGKEACELKLKKGNGIIFHALVESLATDGEAGFRMALIDITGRKQTEQELQNRTDQLSEANREIEAFTYSVSHDLQAPIRAMEGFTKIILNEFGTTMDGELRRRFEVIRSNTKLMKDLIEGLLNLSRIGRREISHSSINMREKFATVWKEVKAEYPGREIEFVLSEMPPAFGDRSLIRQVIYNLLANAAKFTKHSKGRAIIEAGGNAEGDYHVYYVRDNGAGFDMRYYDKLFGVFQRLHSIAEYEGTGIGLALVQSIIHRHGGKVWAEGKIGKGATFWFSLPVRVKQ
jgi:PAS domain S-box-containing protein